VIPKVSHYSLRSPSSDINTILKNVWNWRGIGEAPKGKGEECGLKSLSWIHIWDTVGVFLGPIKPLGVGA
jgi:hypothetical protein